MACDLRSTERVKKCKNSTTHSVLRKAVLNWFVPGLSRVRSYLSLRLENHFVIYN